jgi:uncharacterized membrane protein YphA (DoxX/SURF4 family)
MPTVLLPFAAVVMLIVAAIMAFNGQTALAAAFMALGFMLVAVWFATQRR